MKIASYPGWALEQVAAERKRCHIEPHVQLKMARNACSVCGAIVIMTSPVACVSCGATGKQRTLNPNGNLEAFNDRF